MATFAATIVLTTAAVSPSAAEESAPVPPPVVAAGVDVPDFATKAWIAVDATTGDILAGQNYDEQRPMASTIKTLTALTLMPQLDWDSTYTATARETLTEGAHVGLLAGNRYTVNELFHGMLMKSGNDAAVALAEANGGMDKTLADMNAEAQRVGATSTVAMSPNGLDQPGQVTTAADLAQIYRVAIQDERLVETLTARTAEFPGRPPIDPTAERGTYTLYSNDRLIDIGYPGFLGGKSGFTSQAGRAYVAGAERDGRRIVVSLLGIGGGTTETAETLMDWTFANLDSLSPVGQLPDAAPRADVDPVPAAESVNYTYSEVASMALAADPASAPVTTTTEVSTGVETDSVSGSPAPGAAVATGGFATSPFVAADEPAGKGVFASLFAVLFKVVMWTLLLMFVAVVLLRIRAVRRMNRRKAARAAVLAEAPREQERSYTSSVR